ncbi:MAG: ABC transporter permease [Myxococcota bacterium]
MSRLRALLRKERQHHGPFLLILALVVLPIAGLTMAGVAFAPASLTLFEAHAFFLRLFVPLIGLVLGNRLIVAEYQNRTQLFLEGLPMQRWEMVLLKYALGLLALESAAVGHLLLTALFAVTREPVDGWFLFVMASRTVAWTFAVWGFLFAMGFTGRFRLAIYTSLVFLIFALDSLTGAELGRFGLFAVVDQTLPLERETMPWSDLAVTFAIGAGFSVVGTGLAIVNEGSLAESLSRKMSAREKSAVGAILLIGLIAISAADPKTEAPPFAFPQDAAVLRSEQAPIVIAYDSDDEATTTAAAKIMDELEATLGPLPDRLGWDSLPQIRLASSAALDGRTFEPVGLGEGDGVLVRGALFEADLDRSGLYTTVVREAILAHTHRRANFEPRAFFLDGFSRRIGERSDDATTRRRAGVASTQVTIDRDLVIHWYRAREMLGRPMADALAASGLQALESLIGPDGIAQIARALFQAPPKDDFRSLGERWSLALPELIEEQSWKSFDDWLEAWRAELATARVEVSDVQLDGTFRVETIEGELRRVVGTATSQSTEAGALSLVHTRLGPQDDVLRELELERTDRAWPAGADTATVALEGRYGPGERAFVALERVLPELDCAVRVGAERLTIE